MQRDRMHGALAEGALSGFELQFEPEWIDRCPAGGLRFHWVVPDRATATSREHDADAVLAKQLWGYTPLDAAARTCLSSLTANFTGHESFYIVAADTMMDVPSATLQERFFPEVPLRAELRGCQSFFSSAKAEQLLGWRHDLTAVATA